MKIFIFLILIYFVNISGQYRKVVEYEDHSKANFKTIDDLPEYCSNILKQLSEQPETVIKSYFGEETKEKYLKFINSQNTDIFASMYCLATQYLKVEQCWRILRGVEPKDSINIITLNEKNNKETRCNLEELKNIYKKIIDEIKNNWKIKFTKKDDELCILYKTQNVPEDLFSSDEESKETKIFKSKFNIIYTLLKLNSITATSYSECGALYLIGANIHINKNNINKLFSIIGFGIDYEPKQKKVIENITKFIKNIIQDPDKTKNLPTVLVSIIIDYYGMNEESLIFLAECENYYVYYV